MSAARCPSDVAARSRCAGVMLAPDLECQLVQHILFNSCISAGGCTAASEVRAILEDPAADNLDSSTPNFWLLVAALKKFVVSITRPDHVHAGASKLQLMVSAVTGRWDVSTFYTATCWCGYHVQPSSINTTVNIDMDSWIVVRKVVGSCWRTLSVGPYPRSWPCM